MASDEGDRKLAAILSADVVGYSKLMADDERATVNTLKEYRSAIARVIERHKGRVVNLPGDNILADFPSAVEAVQGAVEIQKVLEGRNFELPADRRMEFRIGVNLGDIIEEADGTIYGDGVNIAARMEALADAGGICISSAVYDAVQGKIDFGFDFLGEQRVKNIDRPINVYRVRAEQASAPTPRRLIPWLVGATAAVAIVVVAVLYWWPGVAPDGDQEEQAAAPSEAPDDPILALPTGPVIAVLPFENLSGNPDEDYFATGLTEDLVVGLSRFSNFLVIARNSTLVYKGKSVDVREVGRDLGAQYVVGGSVRRTDETVRVSVRLDDGKDGTNVWAETYDRDLSVTSLFEVQDDITAKIAATIGGLAGIVERAEFEATRGKPPETLSAYECWLRLNAYYDAANPEEHLNIRGCAERAVVEEPDYAGGWIALASMAMDEHRFGFNPRDNAMERSIDGCRHAVDLDRNNQSASVCLAHALFHASNVEGFLVEAERGVALNPNNSMPLATMGNLMMWSGQLERGMALMRKAIAMNPNHQSWYYFTFVGYHYFRGEYEESLAAALKTGWEGLFWTHAWYAANYAHLGRMEEARKAVAKLLELYPDFGENGWRAMQSYNFPTEYREKLAEGLAKAGLVVRITAPAETH